MKHLYKQILLALCIAFTTVHANATTRKVLFIGNSYTYVNNMPLMLQTLATAQGDTLIYDESDPGAFTFEQHSTYAPTITKIFSQQWDIVVLQEQSQRPAFDPSQVEVEVYPYAHILDSMIHANRACTQTMFMMTWGHAAGDPTNCAVYPPICTYEGMQQRLRESYLEMTQMNNAVVAPVGAAWKAVRDSFPALWLYQADSIHPIIPGSYLETCVLYSSMFHKKTFGCSYTDGLNATDANTLQHFADKITLDSITQWQQYGHYPDAAFNYTLAGNTASFSNIPIVTANNTWDFGDGNTDNTAAPLHTYAASGVYTVTHTVSTTCFSETITETVGIGPAAVGNTVTENQYPVNAVDKGNGNITFIFPDKHPYDVLKIYDESGRSGHYYPVSGPTLSCKLLPGSYIYQAFSSFKKVAFYNKLVVH